MVSLRRLSHLVALADELHFGRAAARVHLSQPALSRSIRQLERELGAPLVIRTTRSVRMTDVGRRLATGAAPLLAQLEGVVQEAEAAGRRRHARLRVGFKAGAAGHLLTPTVKAFERERPDVELELHRLEWADQVSALVEDRVDVAFVWLPTDVTGVAVETVMAEPRCVGVAADDPLAARSEVALDELADAPVVTSRSVPDDIARWWSAIPRPDGSMPPPGPAVDSVEEMLEVVAQGHAVCFVARSFEAFYGRPDVTFVPVIDLEPAPVALAWRAADDRAVLATFRRTAAGVARGLAGAGTAG